MCAARIISIIVCLSFFNASGQNTGIGTTNPQEKLDVNGNLNVTGTIKANGIAGQPGQVLRLHSSGNIEWADLSAYPNFMSFVGNGAWVVPTGVKKIMVEAWGGGGGACNFGGGGGGGYVLALFDVNQGDIISYTAGTGGDGGGFTGLNGQNTNVTVGPYTVIAESGRGAVYNNTFSSLSTAYGGTGTISGGTSPPRFIMIPGSAGKPNTYQYMQSGTSTIEATCCGAGGDAANAPGTGGQGGYSLLNITTSSLIRYASSTLGRMGGGGGAGNNYATPASGGPGTVILRY